MLTGYDISTKVEQDVVDCFESSGASDHERIRKNIDGILVMTDETNYII